MNIISSGKNWFRNVSFKRRIYKNGSQAFNKIAWVLLIFCVKENSQLFKNLSSEFFHLFYVHTCTAFVVERHCNQPTGERDYTYNQQVSVTIYNTGPKLHLWNLSIKCLVVMFLCWWVHSSVKFAHVDVWHAGYVRNRIWNNAATETDCY